MRNPARTFRSTSHALALEQRLLFDGAAMVAAQDVQDTAAKDSEQHAATEASHDTSRDQAALDTQTPATAQSVALIDSRLANQAELAQQLQAQGVQVHLVQAGESGLAAIGDALAAAKNVGDLRIYSHAEHGNQLLGQDAVNQGELQAFAQSDTRWSYYLNDSTNLNIFKDTALIEADITAPAGREFVFVSENLNNWEQLVGELPANVYVVILEADKDGVEQIAAALAHQSNVSAVHIVAHGSPAELQLGTARLNTQSMQSAYLDELAIIGKALTADGDILVYGCNFAQGDAGLQAAMVLGGITGADIAASTDATGAAALGGNWDLETHTGNIEAAAVLTATTAKDFAQLLAVPVDPDDTATTAEDTPLAVNAANGLLNGATDASGHTLSITNFTVAGMSGTKPIGVPVALTNGSVNVGTITINADGSYNYVPAPNYNGTVPVITYTVSDGAGNTDTSTLTITVTAVNDAPVNTMPAGWSTLEDTLVAMTGLSISDVDAGSSIVTVTLTSSSGTFAIFGDNGSYNGVAATGTGTNQITLVGTVSNINTVLATTISANTSRINFRPDLNATAPVTVTMTTNDGGATGSGGERTDTDTAIITIIPRNDAPSGADKTVVLPNGAGSVYTFSVSDFGFSDSDDTPSNNFKQIIVTAIPGAGSGTLTLNGVAVTVNQVITVANLSNLKFTAGPNGLVVGLGFKVVDDGGTANSGQDTDPTPNYVRFRIGPIPDIAKDDFASGYEDNGSVTGNVLANDAARSGGTLSVVRFTVGGNTYTAGQTATIPGVGTLVISTTGAYTFTPSANWNGDIPQVSYVVGESINAPVFGTGRNDANGAVTNVPEQHWTLISGPPGAVQPIVQNHPWFGNQAISSDGGGPNYPVGNYVYETDFYIPQGIDLSTAVMTLSAGADDLGSIRVFVNGTELVKGPLYAQPGGNGTAAMYNWSLPSGANPFQIGGNVVQIVVGNTNTRQALFVNNFTVTYKDTDTGTLDIKILPVNDAPAGTDKTVTINEDTVYTFTTGDFGFTDPLDNPANNFLTVKITTLPSASDGVLKLNGVAVTAGQVIDVSDIAKLTFTPVQDRFGTGIGAFTFQVRDDGGTLNGGQDTDQSPNTFKFNIVNVNDDFTDTSETVSTPEDTPISGNVVSPTTSVDGPVTVVSYTIAGLPGTFNPIVLTTIPGVGSIRIFPTGLYIFTPVADFNGKVPTISYTLTDGLGPNVISTLDITVTPVKDTVADNVTTNEDTAISFNVLTGTNGASADNFEDSGRQVVSITQPSHGSVTFLPDGTLTYTPTANWNGTDTFTYTVKSPISGVTETETVTVTVVPVPDNAVVTNDAQSVTEDLNVNASGQLSVNGAVTIIDPDAGESQFNTSTLAFTGTTAVGGAQLGSVAINADGSYTYTVSNAAVQYLKAGETIVETYTVQSADGTATSTITITIVGVNDAPVVTNDARSVTEDQNVVGGNLSVGGAVTITDTDAGESQFNTSTLAFAGTTAVGGAQLGSVAINADGSYTYTVSNAAVQYLKAGETIVETYTVQSADGTATSTITITIHGANELPVDGDEFITIPQDTTASGNVLLNASDPDGGTLSVEKFTVAGQTYAAGQTAVIAGVGSLSIQANGSYIFVPEKNYSGRVPAATYIVSDGQGGTDTSTLSIVVTPVKPPDPKPEPVDPVTPDMSVHFEYQEPEPPHLQIPNHASDAEFVHPAVVASQDEQWILTELGADKLLLSTAGVAGASKDIASADNVRYVEAAVRASQQVSKIWSLKAQGLEVNLPVQPPQPLEINPWANEASKPEPDQKQASATSQPSLDMDAYWASAWSEAPDSSVESSSSATFSMQLRELARNAPAGHI